MSVIVNSIKGLIQLICVIGFVILSFSVSAMLESKKPSAKERADQDRSVFVDTTTVRSGMHRVAFETTGIVETITDIEVIPQVSGQVIAVNPEFFQGGRFKKDDILFEIDPRDFELEVERLEAEVARARTALSLEQAESQAALIEWNQINGGQDVTDLVARKPQLLEAEANLKAAQAQLKNAALDLERTQMRMPFDGQVLSSTVAVGRYVTAGQSFATVFDNSALEVRVALRDQQLKWLMDEDKADISIMASHMGQTKTYKAFLKRGTSQLDPSTRFANVSFGIEDAHDLLPGVFTSIHIKGPKLNNITRLPASALQKGRTIWVVNREDRLVKIEPNILYATDKYIAVLGLGGSWDVVTSRLDGGQPDMRVMRAHHFEQKPEPEKPHAAFKSLNIDIGAI